MVRAGGGVTAPLWPVNIPTLFTVSQAVTLRGGDVIRTGHPVTYTRAEADGILREAMAVLGVSAWERFVIWSAVRLGGAKGWGS